MMGKTGLQGFLGFINADRDRRFQTGEIATYMPAVSMPGQGGVMALPRSQRLLHRCHEQPTRPPTTTA